jgi:hypothetical protein
LLLASVVSVASGLALADELVECGSSAELEINVGSRGKAVFCVDAEGALNGPAREWYPNGVQRTSDHWKYGVKVGVWIVWDEAGRKREERSFADGKLHGDETLWHANGKRRILTTYLFGIRHGPVLQWDESGELLVSGQFKDDPYRGLFPSPPLFDRMPTYRTQGKRSLNFLSAMILLMSTRNWKAS